MLRAVSLLLAAAGTCIACTSESSGPLELRPVVSENVQALEKEIGPAPETPQADLELVDRARALVMMVARQKGDIRTSFAEQAKELGDAIVPVLSGWIGELGADPGARRAEAELLAALDTPKAARALAYHAAHAPEVWVRGMCAGWLVDVTQDQEMLALIEARLDERDTDVKWRLAGTLGRWGCFAFSDVSPDSGPATARLWNYGDPEGKLPVRKASSRLRLKVWQRVASLEGAASESRERSVVVLGHLPAFAADILAAALRDASRDVRRGAARALASMGPRGAAAGATLHESLQRDPDVTVAAIDALGAMRYLPAADTVAAWMEADRPLEARVAAARALGKLDAPRHVPALERALDPKEPLPLRTAAAIALWSYGRERQALPVMAEALSGSGPEAAAVVEAVDLWLQARDPEHDAQVQRLLQEWVGPSATNASRKALLEGEIQKLLR